MSLAIPGLLLYEVSILCVWLIERRRVRDEAAELEEEKLKEETAKAAEAEVAKKAEEEAKLEAKAQAALAAHDQTESKE